MKATSQLAMAPRLPLALLAHPQPPLTSSHVLLALLALLLLLLLLLTHSQPPAASSHVLAAQTPPTLPPMLPTVLLPLLPPLLPPPLQLLTAWTWRRHVVGKNARDTTRTQQAAARAVSASPTAPVGRVRARSALAMAALCRRVSSSSSNGAIGLLLSLALSAWCPAAAGSRPAWGLSVRASRPDAIGGDNFLVFLFSTYTCSLPFCPPSFIDLLTPAKPLYPHGRVSHSVCLRVGFHFEV